ncbi:hypothetical protein HIM_00771 [Hirsutella minnesotensis 3608]|nr:hypothetical protein HIM_00771 [Hirsutella minnesotensis 3608]
MRRHRNSEQDYNDDGDDYDDIPLHRKQPFGAGLKRKRIEFVPASNTDGGIAASSKKSTSTICAGDLYASIVLGNREPDKPRASVDVESTTTAADEPETCAVCSLPLTTSLRQHEMSLAHQVALAHSHPPSALDRSRMGLRTLQSQGWDPDARRGLGLEGEGVRFPIKVASKDDNLGIGATAPKTEPKAQAPKAAPRPTAKELKAMAAKERQRAERLQAEIYGRVDVERYLRGDAADSGI